MYTGELVYCVLVVQVYRVLVYRCTVYWFTVYWCTGLPVLVYCVLVHRLTVYWCTVYSVLVYCVLCTGVPCTGVLYTVYCVLCTGLLYTVYWCTGVPCSGVLCTLCWCTLATILRLCFYHTFLTRYYEANRFSATHNVLRILWNLNRNYRIRSSHNLLQSISPSQRHLLIFRDYNSFYGEELLATRPTSSWGTTPCLLSATAYSIHSQLHSILEAIPPSIFTLFTDGNMANPTFKFTFQDLTWPASN